MIGSLPAVPSFDGLRQPFADLATIQANIPQVPVAETSQESHICLVLTTRDESGNPAIDEPAGSPRKISGGFSNGGRGRGKA
jgi:hypothetical protein